MQLWVSINIATMIKTSYIAPTSLIELYSNRGDFHLTLAHLLEKEETTEYEKQILESGKPIYLDNGLFENGESVPLEDLIEHACRLNAVYVFAPDVLYNSEETLKNIEPAYNLLQKKNKEWGTNVKLAAVPQAGSYFDYLQCLMQMNQDEKISLIGLSILSIPKSFEEILGVWNVSMSRLLLLRTMLESQVRFKDCHLLGAGSSYVDVSYAAKNCSFVKSHDSSSAIWNGVQEHIIKADGDLDKGKTSVHVDFNFEEALSEVQMSAIEHNIDMVDILTQRVLPQSS